jgi:imidazolonepropionase-like amidohydrolase
MYYKDDKDGFYISDIEQVPANWVEITAGEYTAQAIAQLTPEQIKQTMIDAIQHHLDATARTRGYDGILSLASYAVSAHPPFAAEGRAGADWRDAVWGYGYQVLADVQAGTRTVPSVDALILELPAMPWPT